MSDPDLPHRPDCHDVALVTGAGRGLGAHIAGELFAQGCRVVVTDMDEARAKTTASMLDPSGARAIGLALNVTRKDDFTAALNAATSHWGGVGVLVNNAALTQVASVFDISPEDFDRVTAVNQRGTFFGCQVFGQVFAQNGYGRIINMASLAGQNGGAATGAHYAASKGAIITLTKVFARELAGAGVTVNAISPGPLDVELLPEILPAEKIAGLKQNIPVGQLGDPKFIAQIVCMLASPAAASMTGSTIDANGGLYVR